MAKVFIEQSKNADTRTMEQFDPNEVMEATRRHIFDVRAVGKVISEEFVWQIKYHDWTKAKYAKEFMDCMERAIEGNENFTDLYWYKGHITKEKHHSDQHLHPEYSLLDLMEEIIDKVVAIKGRVGEIDQEMIVDMISQEAKDLAVENFVNMIDNITEIE